MRISRCFLAGAAVVAALALLLLQTFPEEEPPGRDPSEVDDPTRRAEYFAPPDPDLKKPPSVDVNVVPSVVTFPEVRHVATPEVEALAERLVATEVPRVHRKKERMDEADDRNPGSEPRVRSTAAATPPLSPAAAPTTSTFGHSFESLSMNDNIFTTPPDPHGAVGPDHVMNAMNVRVAWYAKDGTLQNSEFLRDFFANSMASSIIADPRVMYDDFEDRWVITTLEITTDPWTSRQLLAVSDTGDPNGSWTQTSFDTLLTIGDPTFGDYPALGLDHQALYVTTNHYRLSDFLLVDARVFVIDKGIGTGGLYDGGTASVSVLDPPGGPEFNFSLSPSHVFGNHPDPSVGIYLASYNGIVDEDTGENRLQVFTLTDPLTTPTFVQEFVNLGHIDDVGYIPPAPQWSGARGIDTGRRLVQSNTVWRNGFLYLSTELTPVSGPDAGTGTAHWFQLNATVPGQTTVFDQGNAGAEDIAPGTRTYWPSVAANAEGAMGITFAMSGPSLHASAGFALRAASDPPGTLRATEILRSGVASYVYLANGRNRWGDYTGVDSDPGNGCFWSFNEYADRWNGWGTAWGQECVDWECGDGDVDPGESCDPPGTIAGEIVDCRGSCTYCGDGTLDSADGELCDDGNNDPGDGCSADCVPEFCGDTSVFPPESCDPPGQGAGQPNACRADCTSCGDGNVDGSHELIVNGDFESGTLFGWTVDEAGDGTFGVLGPQDMVPLSGWPTQPNSSGGLFFAVGDSRNPGTQAVSQAFTVPEGATSVVIEFEMFVSNWNSSTNPIEPPLTEPGTFIDPAGLDHTTANPNQHARVDVLNPGFDPFDTSAEALVTTLYRGADSLSPPASAFKDYGFDVTNRVEPGRTYVLRFASTQNRAAVNLGVDNVKVLATPGEGCDDGDNDTNDDCQSFCEPCPEGLFPTILATAEDRFDWGAVLDVSYVVGDLATVSSLAGTQFFETFTTSIDAIGTPPPGSGDFYLLRFGCPGSTWSSGGSGETGDRDAVLP